MDALPSEPGKARRELMWSGGSLELYVADKRAMTEGDTYGAGAVYRVRVDLVEKTPVDLGALPALRTGDFTAESVVSVYSFTVPAQRGRLLLNAAAGTRLTGLPPSPLSMATMLFDPASKTSVKLESPSSQQDVKASYDVNPQMPATTLAPGLYWLFVDTQSATASAARTDYDLSVDFRGAPANDKCAGAIDATPTGGTARTTTGDTTYASGDTALSDTNASSACYQATLNFLPLVGVDVFYSVVVPPRKRLSATVTPTGTWHPGLWISTECSVAPEFSCLAASAATTSTNPQTVAWTNVATTDKTVYLIVDSGQDSGAFSLATSFTDGPAAPANDTCAGVIALDLTSGSASANGTTEGASDDEHPGATTRSAACQYTSAYYNGADVVYSAVVPAGKRLSVTAFPSGQYNPALWISETCANPEADVPRGARRRRHARERRVDEHGHGRQARRDPRRRAGSGGRRVLAVGEPGRAQGLSDDRARPGGRLRQPDQQRGQRLHLHLRERLGRVRVGGHLAADRRRRHHGVRRAGGQDAVAHDQVDDHHQRRARRQMGRLADDRLRNGGGGRGGVRGAPGRRCRGRTPAPPPSGSICSWTWPRDRLPRPDYNVLPSLK